MGRIKPAWYYEKQAAEAKAREEFYRNRKPTDSTTVKSRSRTSKYYRSLLAKNGVSPLIYKVSVSEAGLALLTTAEAGLKDTLAAGEVSVSIRGSGTKPTMISWYKGTATPTAKKTAWGSRWIQYYDKTGNQSHYSMPFSRETGDLTVDTLIDAFNKLFGPTGTKTSTLLGENNGRAWLDFEQSTQSHDT